MIKYYNRITKEYEEEMVAGGKWLEWMYSTTVGMGLLELVVKRKLFSRFYGAYCNSKSSVKKVAAFVNDFDIDIEQSVKGVDEFVSFNDFFTRKLKPDARPVNMDSKILVSPGDGRLLVFTDIDMDKLVQVKGFTYRLSELVGNQDLATKYQGGVCMILRLCPTDYHRFHFADSGVPEASTCIRGDYYSVNPVALAKVPELFCRNKREWSVFRSDHFGEVLHVEVGATCVGTIVQSYVSGRRVEKGDEKGYFKFGGSTTVLFFQQGQVCIDQDIQFHSEQGQETKVLMGEAIGVALRS